MSFNDFFLISQEEKSEKDSDEDNSDSDIGTKKKVAKGKKGKKGKRGRKKKKSSSSESGNFCFHTFCQRDSTTNSNFLKSFFFRKKKSVKNV